MKRILLLGLFGCAHAAPSPVTPAAVAATKPLGTGLASLGFYVGDWSCAVTDETGHPDKDSPVLEIKVAEAYENWLSVEVWDKGKQLTSELKGIDPAGKFHHLWTGNDGSFGSLTSNGWAGNTMVLEEDRPLATSKTRMTFTKIDDTHYTHLAEVDTGTGWKTEFAKTCHKV
ncbi:hypothetical protein BH11MYX1_BH11MYX1_09310 [soil metagenome]